MKIIRTITFILTVALCWSASAQTLQTDGHRYKTAIGIRGVGTSGLAIKHFNKSNTAFHGIFGFYPNAFSATFLVEKYTPAFEVAGLNWYYGIGGHLATQSDVIRREGVYYREASGVGIGVDGIFGIEYKINEVPIAVSMDVKPFIEVVDNGDAFIALDPGLGIKVTF